MIKRLVYMLSVCTLFAMISGCNWLYQSSNESDLIGRDLTNQNLTVEPFSYINQSEDVISSEDYEGSYWIANVIFTSCPTICNLMTPHLVEIQEKAESRNLDLQFVSFTVDPNHDTPDVLTHYMDRYGVDETNWQFLTGYSEKEIETLMLDSFQSTVLNDPEDPDILHTTNFFLIDEQGQVVRSYDGLGNEDLELLMDDIEQSIT